MGVTVTKNNTVAYTDLDPKFQSFASDPDTWTTLKTFQMVRTHKQERDDVGTDNFPVLPPV